MDVESRIPPHSLEAERSTLGSMALSDDAVDEVCQIIGSDDFYLDAHRRVFSAMLGLRSAHRPIDAVTVAESLASSGQLEEIGGADYLHQLMEAVPHAAHCRYYAEI